MFQDRNFFFVALVFLKFQLWPLWRQAGLLFLGVGWRLEKSVSKFFFANRTTFIRTENITFRNRWCIVTRALQRPRERCKATHGRIWAALITMHRPIPPKISKTAKRQRCLLLRILGCPRKNRGRLFGENGTTNYNRLSPS